MGDSCQILGADDIRAYDAVKTVEVVAAMITTFISLSFLIFAIILRFYREFLFKIAMGIITSGLFFSLIPAVKNHLPSSTNSICSILGLVQTYWTFSALIWCTSFAHAAYLVARGGSPHNIVRWFWKYLAIALLLPLASIVPFILTPNMSCYEKSSGYCRLNYKEIGVEVFSTTLTVWIGALIITVICYRLIRKEMNECGLPIKHRVYALPAASLLCWLPVIVGYFQASQSQVLPNWFILIHTSCLYLFGFLNVIAYGCSRRARAEFLKVCLGRKPVEPQEESEVKCREGVSDSFLPEAKTSESIGRVAYFSYNRTICLSTLRDSFA